MSTRFRLTGRRIALASAVLLLAALLIAMAALGARRREIAEALPDQNAAARWGGDAVQMSVFFPADRPYPVSSVPYLARQLDDTMTAASLDAPAGGRLWYHAYSTETETSLSTDRTSLSVLATVYGGDFFRIHPPTLLSGSIPAEGAAGDGSVFLDERAAFALFGAVDVAGSTVFLGGQPYTVCGVTVPQENEFYDGWGEIPRIFVLYTSAFGRGITDARVWEAVLPEPVGGFGRSAAETVFAGYEGFVLVENSARFSLGALRTLSEERETLGVRTSAITYPFWENIARVAEYRASVLLTAQTVLAVPAALLLLAGIAGATVLLRRRLRKKK